MDRRIWSAALIGCLLALPGVQAAPGPRVLDAQVQTAFLHGQVGVEGLLASFHSVGDKSQQGANPVEPPPPARIAPSGFVLYGQDIDVAMDVRHGDPTLLVASPPSPTETVDAPFQDGASGATTAVRADFSFFVAPLPGVAAPRVTLACGEGQVEASGDLQKEASRYVLSDRPALRGASPSSSWTRTSGWTSVAMDGDFAMMLWDIDFDVQDANATHSFKTGYFFESSLPVDTGDYNVAGRSESRQAYLVVRGGHLEFTFPESAALALNFVVADAQVEGQASFTNAAGSLQTPDGAVAVSGAASIDGQLAMSFGVRRDNRFDANVSGSPTHAVTGGRLVTYGTIVEPPAAGSPSVWLVGAIGVAALVTAGVPLARRSALRRQMARLEALAEAGQFRAVVRAVTPGLLRSRRFQEDTQVVRSVSLLRLDRLTEAQASLDGWQGPQSAQVDYLWAFLHAKRGESSLARHRIASCLARDETMRLDVESNPLFASLLRQPTDRRGREREGYT